MIEYKILDYVGIDFPFFISRGVHTKSFTKHSHNFIELEIIIGGYADHIVDGRTHQISKGDVVVILPSVNHELLNVHDLELYNFKFDLDKLILLEKDIEKLSGFQSLFIFQPMIKYQNDYVSHMTLEEEQLSNASMLCELIYREWKSRKDGYKWVIISYFLSLITYLSRNFTSTLTSNSPKIQEIVSTTTFIQNNLSEKITLPMLSSMACLSERQYTRIFKEVYGISPIEYVINCRLTLACRIMKNSNLSLSEISVACGFGDTIAFSRIFKRRYEMTPGEYRKNIQVL